MKTENDLKKLLLSIDHRGYPAYKGCAGCYQWKDYILSIDHVQGDPFASPSSLSIHVPLSVAGFPKEYYENNVRKITLEDHILRLFQKELDKHSFQAKGSGKSGLLSVTHCGEEILERTACEINPQELIVRFYAGFPAHGRTIDSHALIKILFDYIPKVVASTLYYRAISKKDCEKAIFLADDQQMIREELKKKNLCAFIADGSILPRTSGISDRPMKNAIPFQSPESMKVTINLPHHGPISGMGIPNGITLFVGGGYHGKSTVLKALELGVYNHIAGDGREYVISEESAFKLRAEDGRSISNVDISPFISHLPNKKDTVHFSTEDASGSTSQAANLIESMESGSKLLLIDEDTSATNFMIRDELMQRVIAREEEPITPFIERVQSLYTNHGISSIIVAGSSGAYFQVADQIIQMKEYVPHDITERAKKEASSYPAIASRPEKLECHNKHMPEPNTSLAKERRIKTKCMGTDGFMLGRDTIELRYLEQLTDSEQTVALSLILKQLELTKMNGKITMTELVNFIEHQMDTKGLASLSESQKNIPAMARPRRQEIFAAINRYRK